MAQQQGIYYDDAPLPSIVPNRIHRRSVAHPDEIGVSEGSNSSVVGWAGWVCIGFIVLGVVFSIIAIVSLVQSNHVQSGVNQQMASIRETLALQQSSQSKLETKVVVMNTHRQPLLCSLKSYYSKKGEALLENGDTLEPLTQTIEALRHADMKEFYYYHVSAWLRLSVTSDKLHKEYLNIEHNITSNFGHLSSVMLEELEFDTLDQSLGATRSIVLCTNNPFLDVQRCDGSLTKRNILALHGQERVPLLITLPLPTNVTRKQEAIVLEQEEDEEDIVMDESPDHAHKNKQRREVIGLRMYNLVFYQAEESLHAVVPSVPTKARTHGSGSLDTANSYKEKRILTIDLPQC